MSSLPVLDTANRWTATTWPSETACEQLSPAASTTAVEEVSDLCQDEERTFEMLIPEVLQLIIQDGEKATVVIRDAIRAEQNWQRILSERMNNEQGVLSDLQKRNSFAQKAVDLVPTLSLVAGGIMTMASAGELAALPLGAVVLGGLLVLDSLFLDHSIKKVVATFLGMKTGNDSRAWLQKINVFTNLLVMGLCPVVVTNGTGMLVAQSAAGFVANAADASSKYSLDQQMARMVEGQRYWGTSRERLEELFGDANSQMETINSLYDMLNEYHQSLTQTTERIFRS